MTAQESLARGPCEAGRSALVRGVAHVTVSGAHRARGGGARGDCARESRSARRRRTRPRSSPRSTSRGSRPRRSRSVASPPTSNDPTGGSLGSAFDGVKAYFDYINSKGGVYGRKLVLDSKRDDGLANNRSEVQGLLTKDDVFAALPIAVQLFTGADLLAEAGIPTYGWDINEEWGSENHKPGPPNFFTQVGDYICFTCANPSPQTLVAEEARPPPRRCPRVQRVAVRRRAPTGLREQLQEVPDRQDRVPRQEPLVRHPRLQRAGRADEGQGRRPRHLVSRRERCHHARARDEEAGAGRGADPAELVQPQAGQEERRRPQRELPVHDVHPVRGEARSLRA